ncbi:hypothetical protein ACI2KV_11770 [Micromonospora chokoriensis]
MIGRIPVDSGQILLVDPANLSPELVDRLTKPNAHGATVAVVAATPNGDGWYEVEGEPGALVVRDPHFDGEDEPADGGWSSAVVIDPNVSAPDDLAGLAAELPNFTDLRDGRSDQ